MFKISDLPESFLSEAPLVRFLLETPACSTLDTPTFPLPITQCPVLDNGVDWAMQILGMKVEVETITSLLAFAKIGGTVETLKKLRCYGPYHQIETNKGTLLFQCTPDVIQMVVAKLPEVKNGLAECAIVPRVRIDINNVSGIILQPK